MRKLLILAAIAAVLVTGAAVLRDSAYRIGVVLGSATNIVRGGSVLVNGFRAGTVSDIGVRDGKAYVELELDDTRGPLHAGATVTVAWKALLGERLLEVHDGPDSGAAIPSGGMITGDHAQPMELDHILTALDPEVRTRLAGLIGELDATLRESHPDLTATLRSSGPALAALGSVLKAVGSDGEAMKQLVGTVNAMTTTLARHDAALTGVVDNLSLLTATVATQRQRLSQALRQLPGTLDEATATLAEVPSVAQQAVPLLADLGPLARKLPSVARNLAPVMADLRPLVGELGPTVVAARDLLDLTPSVLDSATATLPGVTRALGSLQPVLSFLRPYTPEVASFFALWGSAFGNYDANGHYARIFAPQAGLTSVNNNPGLLPPGVRYDPYPLPGAAGNQPWQDAFGSGIR
jgi:phospholipid/cholesterol/gamma-HCH transport system substrate-binding protein